MARKSRIQNKRVADIQSLHRIYQTGLYVRLSVLNGGKKDSGSVETQESILRNFIKGKSEFSLFSIYIDNGETGVDFERDEFERLVSDVRNGQVDCIIVKDLSRFGRNYIEAGEYLEKIFPFMGVRFIAINDHYDSIDPSTSDTLTMHLKNLMNDIYARDISRKICPVLRSKQEQGAFIGAWAPYGYRKSESDRHQLVIDDKTAPIVREMFRWRYEGWSYSDIVRELRVRDIPSPSRYRYEEGIIKDKRLAGAIWKVTTVQRILSRQVYIGHMVQGQKQGALWKGQKQTVLPKDQWVVIPNTHRAIIDEKIFFTVQKMNEQRLNQTQILQGRFQNIEDTENIMEGLAVCGHCGKKLIRHRSVREYKNRSHQYRVWYAYYCPTHRVAPNLCPSTGIPENELLTTVYELVKTQFLLADNIRNCINHSYYLDTVSVETEKLTGKVKHIKSELERIKRHEELLYEDYAERLMSEHDYVYTRERYQKKKENYCRLIKELNEQIIGIQKEKEEEKLYLNTTLSFSMEAHLTKPMAEALVKRITVYCGKGIDIQLRFENEYQRLLERAMPHQKEAANE